MFITSIEALTISEAWWKSLSYCMRRGRKYIISGGSSGTEGKKRRELDLVVIRISRPGIRPLTPDVPNGVPAPTSDDFIADYLNYLLTSIKSDNEQYTYGEYIEPQFFEVVEKYKEQGFSTNQGCMNVGEIESVKWQDPPCLRLIDTKIVDNTLHWYVWFRSWDLRGGFPTNMGGLQMAKEMMASLLNVSDGELVAISKGLHLYDSEWEVANMVLREHTHGH